MIVTGALWLCTASTALAAAAPEYFNLPAGYSASTGIAAAADGTVWFPANPSTPNPALGRLDTALASPGTANGMTIYPTPLLSASCCANAVRSVAYDPANNRVWFVQNDGIVGFASPPAVSPGTSNGIQARLVTNAPSLLDIAVAPSGLAWFTENSSSNVSPYPGGRIASIDGGLSVGESENIALQGGATHGRWRGQIAGSNRIGHRRLSRPRERDGEPTALAERTLDRYAPAMQRGQLLNQR